MAQSRLERIGTIFSRITSLMKGGALKPEDKPLWYDIYKAFPPKEEPRFDRAAPNIAIKDIFYKEDIIRGKFQKDHAKLLMNNLIKEDQPSYTQKFIIIYQDLEKTGVPAEELYEKALEIFKEQNANFRYSKSPQSRLQPQVPLTTQNKETETIKLNIEMQELFKM